MEEREGRGTGLPFLTPVLISGNLVEAECGFNQPS